MYWGAQRMVNVPGQTETPGMWSWRGDTGGLSSEEISGVLHPPLAPGAQTTPTIPSRLIDKTRPSICSRELAG
jgi:hypothetical protein